MDSTNETEDSKTAATIAGGYSVVSVGLRTTDFRFICCRQLEVSRASNRMWPFDFLFVVGNVNDESGHIALALWP